jgi:hypothetical protein
MPRTTLYTPRTISLQCELLHAPLQPDPVPIQRVHDQLYRSGAPPYTSFMVTPGGTLLSNPVAVPGANSYAAFRPDRFQFCEELSSVTYDEFAGRVRAVSERVATQRGLPLFTGQIVTLRTLVNPRAFRDSREYLKLSLLGLDDELEAFGREPALLGVRFVFPAGPGEPGSHALRIESFSSDPRSLFLEIVSTYGPIRTDGGLVQVEENIHASYRFVTERAMRFVGAFDAAGAAGGDDAGP